jgi:RecA-family ATPase
LSTDFAAIMQPVAHLLLGEPNRTLSSKTELRYGKRGSLSVDLTKGTWFDNEAGQGGGLLDLITRETRIEGPERFEWLRDNGFEVGEESRKPNGKHGPMLGPIVATYDYTDEAGKLLFQVTRHDPKDFRQRRPDGSGGWIWGVRGVRIVPYRLPDIIEHADRMVLIVEGEKDADNLWKRNIPATTNPMGAGKWRAELSEFFAGSDVVIVPDRDPQKRHEKTGEPIFHDDGRPVLPGQDHAQDVASRLYGVAARVRVLELWTHWPDMPPKGDISDWFEKGGGTPERLHQIIEETLDWMPGEEPAPETEQAKLPPLVWINIRPWDSEPAPDRLWAIFNRSPLNQAGLFSGEGGTGKSIIELTKNVAHVIGRDWFGSLPAQGPSFYIGCEDEADELHRRLVFIAAHYGVKFSDLAKDGLYIMSLLGQDATLVAVSRTGKIETTQLYKQLYQAAGDIKPKNISIDTLSRAFAGNEIDRVHVYGFAQHMQALAMVARASVTVLSHPSLMGMTTGSGISGSTAWHNAFRFRHYLKGSKGDGEEPADTDVREIQFLKNQYGRREETIHLKYDTAKGLFVLAGGSTSDRPTDEAIDQKFLTTMAKLINEGRTLSPNKGPTYAPALVAEHPAGKPHTSRTYVRAMSRLIEADAIHAEQVGRPGKWRTHLRLGPKPQLSLPATADVIPFPTNGGSDDDV